MKLQYILTILILSLSLIILNQEGFQPQKRKVTTELKRDLLSDLTSKISYEYYSYKIDLIGCIKYKNNNSNKQGRYQLSKAIPQFTKATKTCLDLIDDLCLVYVNISILSPNECSLNYFYNYVQKSNSMFNVELETLTKGMGLALLKSCIQKAVRDNYLNSDAKITLYASGQKENAEEMIGLIRFYEYLGLRVTDQSTPCIENNFCFMEGNVQSILDKTPKINELLQRI